MQSAQLSEVVVDLWSILIGTLPALGAHRVLGEAPWALKGRSGSLSEITSGRPHPPLGSRSCFVMRQCANVYFDCKQQSLFSLPSSL